MRLVGLGDVWDGPVFLGHREKWDHNKHSLGDFLEAPASVHRVAKAMSMHEWPIIVAYRTAANMFVENYKLQSPQEVGGRVFNDTEI